MHLTFQEPILNNKQEQRTERVINNEISECNGHYLENITFCGASELYKNISLAVTTFI
jgi:hypothetical protein